MPASKARLIGVDCSTDPTKVGLAVGHLEGGKLFITHAKPDKSKPDENKTWGDIEETVAEWIDDSENCLLAFDAPLGWPRPLGEALVKHEHMAGAVLEPKLDLRASQKILKAQLDQMFHRKTEQRIYEDVFEKRKKPLGVGEDKIARTAHVALSFLQSLRNETKWEIPLAWKPGCVEGVSVIEVYPAATLEGRNIRHADCRGKRGKEKQERLINWREDVIGRLEVDLDKDGIEKTILESGHVFDAALCVLTAADFVRGDVQCPTDLALAKQEGWIWVKKP
ncbi:MAG: DUF429 domain-containing protein [Gammaproteobacteria bacterium]|nr:DUF429 domain-containing protein [Gammaproteobacteria bacterium]